MLSMHREKSYSYLVVFNLRKNYKLSIYNEQRKGLPPKHIKEFISHSLVDVADLVFNHIRKSGVIYLWNR